MKAIISKIQTSWGQQIQILGTGETEKQARIAAFSATHQGINNFDEEEEGGELIDSDPAIDAYAEEYSTWPSVEIKGGRLVMR